MGLNQWGNVDLEDIIWHVCQQSFCDCYVHVVVVLSFIVAFVNKSFSVHTDLVMP